VLGTELQVAHREQIRELDRSLAAGERLRGTIDKLVEAHAELEREMEEARSANQQAVADEAAPMREKTELLAAIAGEHAEKEILDQERAKIASDLDNYIRATQDAQRVIEWTEHELVRVRGQRQQLEEHWDLLHRAGVKAKNLPNFIEWVRQGKTADDVYKELRDRKRELEDDSTRMAAEKLKKKAADRQLFRDLRDIRAEIARFRGPPEARDVTRT
jgi:myosin heavy subunit